MSGQKSRYQSLGRAELESALGARNDVPHPPHGNGEFENGQLVSAAVLCPILERSTGLTMLFTRRTDSLPRHAGQISFPGGRIEAGDASPLAAALREAEEEVGLAAHQVTPIGELAPYRTGTGYEIVPCVGFVAAEFAPVIDTREVAEVFEVPLLFLLNPHNLQRQEFVGHHGHSAWYDTVRYGQYQIWGATAAILRSLAERIGWGVE